MSPDDAPEHHNAGQNAGQNAGRGPSLGAGGLVLKDQQRPLPLPQESGDAGSGKAWSPIPMDLNGLIDRERMALISPLESHPDAPPAPTAPAPVARATPEATAPSHPSAIANHLTSHNGFLTSDRSIGLKLTGRNLGAPTTSESPAPAPAPASAFARPGRSTGAAAPPGSATTGAPSGRQVGSVIVHQDSVSTLPDPPPAVDPVGAPAAVPAPTSDTAADQARVLPGETNNAAAPQLGQRLIGEADETGIVSVPALGTARSFGADPTAGKQAPLATPGSTGPNVFATAPSGPPTAPADAAPQTAVERGIDWRIPAIGALGLAYLPIIVRSLLALHPTNVLGFGIIAVLFVPLVFLVGTARRSLIAPLASRTGDLAVGAALGTAALLCSLLLPRLLGPSAAQWRPELMGLPLALSSAVVLLWGRRFALDVREALATAALASPVLASPVLLSGPFPFAGGTNPVSLMIGRLLVHITGSGATFSVGPDANAHTVDLHRLNDLRTIVLAVAFASAALLLTSKVDPTKPGAAALTDNERQARMVLSLVLVLITAFAIDTVLGVIALAGGEFAPQALVNGLTSTAAVCVLFAMVTLSVARWCRMTGLFIPTLRGLKRAPMKFPEPGPRSTVDRIIVIGSVCLLMVSALTVGLTTRRYMNGTRTVDSHQSTIGNLTLPAGFALRESTNPDQLHAYIGSQSRWTRLAFDEAEPGRGNLSQLHFDIVSARRQLLTTFPLVSLYELGSYRPLSSSVVDLGGGASGLRETFYDATSHSTWSALSFFVDTGSGATVEKIVISGTGAGEPEPAPEPAPRAFAGLLQLPASLPGGADGELAQGRVALVEDTIAGIARSEIDSLRAAAVVPPAPAPTPADAPAPTESVAPTQSVAPAAPAT